MASGSISLHYRGTRGLPQVTTEPPGAGRLGTKTALLISDVPTYAGDVPPCASNQNAAERPPASASATSAGTPPSRKAADATETSRRLARRSAEIALQQRPNDVVILGGELAGIEGPQGGGLDLDALPLRLDLQLEVDAGEPVELGIRPRLRMYDRR